MNHIRVDAKFIPLDKSWIIRMGVLDLLSGHDTTVTLLRSQKVLSNDLKSLLKASEEWPKSKEIHVGESGTLYRFLRFASWKYALDKSFVLEGTLKNRDVCGNPEIVGMPLAMLLTLDNQTSQWASAAILMGNREAVPNPPYKLSLTIDALWQWKVCRSWKRPWPVRYDDSILTQANAFANGENGKVVFVPKQAEDYCFSRAFGLMNKDEAAARWPSLAGHESNRLESVEVALRKLKRDEVIESRDHRVVQAAAMLAQSKGIGARFAYPECVNKSWPQFWDFLYTYTPPLVRQ